MIVYTSLSTAKSHMHQEPWTDPTGRSSYVYRICEGCAEYKGK